MTKQVKIYDTTLRDGAQSVGVTFSLEDKLRIAAVLDDFGVHYIEGGWPGSNPKDMAFFKEARKLRFKNARLSVFSSTKQAHSEIEKEPNIQKLIAAETPVVTIFGKSWDLHVTTALNISLDENLEMIRVTIEYLRRYFDEVIFDAEHFFDGYKNNREYAEKVIFAAREAGCHWIVLCDTNGGTLPGECEKIVNSVNSRIDIPLGIHTHNDSELAVANSLIAVNGGVQMVQGTINGLGERCGNANLCSIIPNLSLKTNFQTILQEKLKKLPSISRLVSELSNQKHPPYMPFVGKNAFAHKGGIHVSAVRKDTRTYEHIDPDIVGNSRIISVSELSGKSNMLEKARELNIEVDENSPTVRKILQKVKDLEARGYYFEGAEASFELLWKKLLGREKSYFSLHGYRIIIWKNASERTYAEATIKAEVPDEISRKLGYGDCVEHTSTDGSGPVEALDKALRKVLEKFYPTLRQVKLTDYKVRILNEEAGTSAVTRVLIESTDGKKKWGTVGVSDNIIDASWQALVDSLIYKLMKDDEEKEDFNGKQN
ncbi:MAG: citramalate synthase [Candidatus Aminicenantes bacterium]|nr:citramalate synthase [Candidatus Aminicenantes bacterium]